jgi:molecular chaperone GrpE
MQDEDIILEDDAEAVSGKLHKLREELKKCHSEKEEYLTGWQRTKADMVNARKLADAEFVEKVRDANRALILSLVPVIDSFEMAMKGAAWDTLDQSWRSGAEGIYAQLCAVLKSYGAESYDPAGTPFDPHHHEPLRMVTPPPNVAPHTVVETFQRGYTLHGKVIRPAKVSVAEELET